MINRGYLRKEIVVAEREFRTGDLEHPLAKGSHEAARFRTAETTSSASVEGARTSKSDAVAIGAPAPESKRSDAKVEGTIRPGQEHLVDRLKKAPELDKDAYLGRQLEQLERRSRELSLPGERRSLTQRDNMEHNTERAREQLAKARLTANEIAERRNTEYRAEQQSTISERAYAQFRDGLRTDTLEKQTAVRKQVHGMDLIIPKDAPRDPDSPEFWNHHGNSREVYDKFARQYPEIQKQLAGGKTIAEVGADPELRGAASFWFGKRDIVANHYKSNMFVESGYHRAKLAREYKLTDVPVSVHEWREKEDN